MELFVSPMATIEQPLGFAVTAAEPGAVLRLSLSATDSAGRVFSSTTDYRADADGCVNAASSLPMNAQWARPAAHAPVWTLRSDDGHPYEPGDQETLQVSVRVRSSSGKGQKTSAQRSFTRGAAPITPSGEAALTFGDIPAVAYRPAGPRHAEAAPGVVVLPDVQAPTISSVAPLAAAGFTVAGLNWSASLPANIDALLRALEHFHHHPAVDSTRPLSIIGVSRGSELALDLATRRPDLVGPLVLHSPTATRTASPSTSGHGQLWALDSGAPPIAAASPLKEKKALLEGVVRSDLRGQPRTYRAFFDAAWAAAEGTPEARFELGELPGPVLMTRGTDQPVWDCAAAIETITAGLRCESFSTVQQGAGHGQGFPFTLPGLPAATVEHANGHRIALGGTQVANGEAAEATRQQVLSFLTSALQVEQ